MELTETTANEKGSAPVGPILISVSEADVSGANQTGKVSLSSCATYIACDRLIQDENKLADKAVLAIHSTVSSPRMSRYSGPAGKDKRLALRLHTWNAAVAASLLPTLHLTEVAIRNFALQRLRSFYKTPLWYDCPKLIRKLGGTDSQMAMTLRRAYQDEVKAGRTGDLSNYITSELPFGFWVNIFTSRFSNELWSRPLHTYNTGFPRGSTLETIHKGVDDVRVLRNNVAHHKNLVCKPVKEKYERTLVVLSWFCKQSSLFARETATFPQVWACCPVDSSMLSSGTVKSEKA